MVKKISINVFRNSYFSSDKGIEIDPSVYLKETHLRINQIESNMEEDIDMKKELRIKNLPCSIENTDGLGEFYVDSCLNGPIIIQSTAHVDFNDNNLDNVPSIEVNSIPVVSQQPTPKH